MDTIQEEDTTSNEGSEHNVAEPLDSADNIKLQRVTGVSLRHTKQPTATVLKEGWMVHYTNKSAMVGGASPSLCSTLPPPLPSSVRSTTGDWTPRA